MRWLVPILAACAAKAPPPPEAPVADLGAVEPPTALLPPSGPPCYAIDEVLGGKVNDRYRMWLDAKGRPIYMDRIYAGLREPAEWFAWTYDARGFLATQATLNIDGGAVDAFRYGAHGELLEHLHRERPPRTTS